MGAERRDEPGCREEKTANERAQTGHRSRSGPPPPAFPIVGVGASAGGLEAFTELLRNLPADTGMAFILVQHLDPTQTSILSDALGRVTSMPVQEVRDGLPIRPDHVYVIAPNTDVGVFRGAIRLLPQRRVEGQAHLSIDLFL